MKGTILTLSDLWRPTKCTKMHIFHALLRLSPNKILETKPEKQRLWSGNEAQIDGKKVQFDLWRPLKDTKMNRVHDHKYFHHQVKYWKANGNSNSCAVVTRHKTDEIGLILTLSDLW